MGFGEPHAIGACNDMCQKVVLTSQPLLISISHHEHGKPLVVSAMFVPLLLKPNTAVCRDASSTLLAWGFWRVLLDEAQLVAHTSSVAAQKASSLWRRHAWTVTGTPLSHRLSELKVPIADVQLDLPALSSALCMAWTQIMTLCAFFFPSFNDFIHECTLVHDLSCLTNQNAENEICLQAGLCCL